MKRALAFFVAFALCFSLACTPALASCSHSWTSWERTLSEEGSSQLITGCKAIYETLERFCMYCGEVQSTTAVTELPHIWVSYGSVERCSRCGSERASVK